VSRLKQNTQLHKGAVPRCSNQATLNSYLLTRTLRPGHLHQSIAGTVVHLLGLRKRPRCRQCFVIPRKRGRKDG